VGLGVGVALGVGVGDGVELGELTGDVDEPLLPADKLPPQELMSVDTVTIPRTQTATA
jgi:hypothetical protein